MRVPAQLQNLEQPGLLKSALKWFIQVTPTASTHTASSRRRKALTADVGFHPATQQFRKAGGIFSFLPRKQMGRIRLLNSIAVSVFRRAMLLVMVSLSKSSWMMMVLTGYSSWAITLASILAIPTITMTSFLEREQGNLEKSRHNGRVTFPCFRIYFFFSWNTHPTHFSWANFYWPLWTQSLGNLFWTARLVFSFVSP